MRICDITHSYALQNHARGVEETISKLRGGKSKHRNLPGEEITWWYDVAIQVRGYSFGDLLAGAHHRDDAQFDSLDEDAKLEDVLSRMFVSLASKTDSRWGYRAGIPREEFTPEIIAWAREYVRR